MHLVDITMFYAAEGGGVSTYLNAKAAWLARRRHAHGAAFRHTIMSPNVETCGYTVPALVRIPAAGLPGFHGYRMPLTVGAPARLLAAARPDLVEAGDAGHCAWAALRLRRRHDIPAVAFYHSDLPRLVQPRLGDWIARGACRYLANLYRQFDLVLAPSRVMVQQLEAIGVHGAVHQPLGIDSGVFHPRRRDAALRRRLGLRDGTRLLVYAGRVTPEKKLGVLAEAVRKLGGRYHLLLVGAGGAAGSALPAGSNISRLPFERDQRRLAALLAGCDVLVHPGDCETFGLIVLEAMACGLPVVAANGGGVAELVDGDTGILAEPNSPDSLAGAIEAVYARDLGRIGLAARRKAVEHYDWERILPQVLGRYAGLLAGYRHALPPPERVCVTD
ncbi:glycosyltransferase family 1 protein [Massilia forsythiae]|uniref:Glycosyltransferase family 1 protein n=1 Tax=Massilia forsythiae TaxID=2728020 RepID=A0A7Z2ZS34_9BURK|nr:glycosyltransferase [Massilia forsythiae]QJD98661.1 glycosyltransferase family 1 protein [Massilia forsythiae]